jgi:endo-1,4-beta-xylanase
MVYLKSLAGSALFASLASAAVLPRQATSLHEAFVAAGKSYFGTASDQALLQNTQNEAIVRAQFGALTPENSMKWESIERLYSLLIWRVIVADGL